MTLAPGAFAGPYEIVSPLGSGGFGEVYLAKDSRLNRLVALKILPSSSPELKARFAREAKAIAGLSHRHICALYDVGTHGDIDYLVMEYLEGETLAARLARGPLAVDSAVAMAAQVIAALDHAHRSGIVHRDLKPANVMITKGGLKLLDFGLAKLRPDAASGNLGAVTHSMAPVTSQGVILGTLPYMAPEQVEGGDADHQSDVWAFGCLLYEMLTGDQTFKAPTQARLIAAILDDRPPDISKLPIDTPSALRRVIETCLAKDPNDRFQSSHDVGLPLRWLQDSNDAPHARPAEPNWRRRAVAAGIALAIGSAATAAIVWAFGGDAAIETAPVTRLAATLPEGVTFVDDRGSLAVSPDGRRIVFAGKAADGVQQLYVRQLDQLDAFPVRGSETGYGPFFSPDGTWVGFYTSPGPGGELKKIALTGGPAVTLAKVRFGYGASWSRDDSIVYTTDFAFGSGVGLARIDAAGRQVVRLAEPDSNAGEMSYRWPDVLPHGKAVLFTVQTTDSFAEGARIVARSLDTGRQHTVIEQGYNARYLETGHIVYVFKGALMAVRFDADALQVTGSPVMLVDAVKGRSLSGEASFAVSPHGEMAYVAGPTTSGTTQYTLVWVDRNGREEALPLPPRTYTIPRLSPDGRRIALDVRAENADTWIWDFERQTLTRLTSPIGPTLFPVWLDHRRLMFAPVPRTGGARGVYLQAADGAAPADRLFERPYPLWPDAVSSDGSAAVIRMVPPETGHDLHLWTRVDNRVTPLVATKAREVNGSLSPDGRWLAYESDESGQPQIYVRALSNINAARWQISTDGGTRPVFSPDGREIFYWAAGPRGWLMAATITAETDFKASAARRLFEGDYHMGVFMRSYDVSHDARRFLFIKKPASPEPTGQAAIVVVLNGVDELRNRRAAVQ